MTSWPNGAPWPGDRAELSRRVEAADIELFTRISGDRNPLHYDQEAARASRFGEIIVQGGVTSAILNAVVAERLPGPGTVFLQVEWRFLAPVRPGDEITGAAVTVIGLNVPLGRLRGARLDPLLLLCVPAAVAVAVLRYASGTSTA